jgi:hypothetical protein
MAFSPPVRKTPERIRQFNGIGGPVTQVLVLKGKDDGRDYSQSIANEVQDFFLGERGSLMLRRGFAKISRTGELKDITAIFQVTLAGVQQYGIITGGSVSLFPYSGFLPYAEVEEPELPDLPVDWPDGWPKPDDVVDEVPVVDPSEPPGEQACSLAYEWVSSPDILSFVMSYGGPVPASQAWYWGLKGYSAGLVFSGSFNVDPAWLSTGFGAYWQWDTGTCFGYNIQQLLVSVTGKDSSGNWIAPGSYSFVKGVTYNDGTTKFFTVGLQVVASIITLTPTSSSDTVITGDTGNKTQTINVANTGDAGSVLNWTAAITGDAALTAIMGLSASTGTVNQGASQNITLTLTNPGAVAVGTYSATISFTAPDATTKTFTVQLIVAPLYAGSIKGTIVDVRTIEAVDGNPAFNPLYPATTSTTTTGPTTAARGSIGDQWRWYLPGINNVDIRRSTITNVWSATIYQVSTGTTIDVTASLAFASDGCPKLNLTDHTESLNVFTGGGHYNDYHDYTITIGQP